MLSLWTAWPVGPATGMLILLMLAGVLSWLLARLLRSLPGGLDKNLPVCSDRLHPRRRLVFCLVSLSLSLLCVWRFGATGAAAAAVFFVCVLLALAWMDAETGYLPDALTLPLLVLGLLCNMWGGFVAPRDAWIGAVAAYVALWCVRAFFLWLRGQEALGGGDVKLLAALGAWLGWMALPRVLLISASAALIVVLVRRVAGHLVAGQPFAFGPYLAAAGLIVLLGG